MDQEYGHAGCVEGGDDCATITRSQEKRGRIQRCRVGIVAARNQDRGAGLGLRSTETVGHPRRALTVYEARSE